jgi:hypothetical protein
MRDLARVDDRRHHSCRKVRRLLGLCAGLLRAEEDALQKFVRLAGEGSCGGLFQHLAAAGGPPAEVLIDSPHIKAHHSGGQKTGRSAGRSG